MTDISTPESAREALHVDPQQALEREIEIAKLAARLRREYMSYRANLDTGHSPADFERGARAGLSAYRECYELCVYITGVLDPSSDYESIDGLVELARAAVESANA